MSIVISENSPDPCEVQFMKRRTPTAQIILSSGENSGSGLENSNKRFISSPNLRMSGITSGYSHSFRGALVKSPDPGKNLRKSSVTFSSFKFI